MSNADTTEPTDTTSDEEWLPGHVTTSGSGETMDDDDEESMITADECSECTTESDSDSDEEERRVNTRRGGGGAGMIIIPIQHISKKRRRDKDATDDTPWSSEEEKYISSLDISMQEKIMEAHKLSESVGKAGAIGKMPYRVRALLSNASPAQKQILLQKIAKLQAMDPSVGEYHMMHHWVDSAIQLPLGTFRPLPIQNIAEAPQFLQTTREQMDKEVYGHKETKNQILRIMAQWIANPSSKGNVIGIYGGAGVGKTTLVKEGISKALGLPFAFMALGGASDGAFLEGHSYTYQGASYGRIADVLMKTQCMNPVIFMDELDKISDTPKGQEVTSILMHLTDASQNERFSDRYFADLELDLSKALFVFSYNDPSKVNPILLDRMIQIQVAGYSTSEKRTIARDYMLPKMLPEYGLTSDQVKISDAVLSYILERLPKEDGVRTFKRGLESILSWVNMLRFTEPERITFPFTVDTEFVDTCLEQQNISTNSIAEHVLMSMYL